MKKKKNKPSKHYSKQKVILESEETRSRRVIPESNFDSGRTHSLPARSFVRINGLLFFLFLFLLPTQLGKHFFLPFSYLNGVRVDYLAPTIYLTDILAFLIIFVNLKTVIKFFSNKKILLALVLLLINIVFSKSVGISVYRYIKIVEFLAVFSIVKDLFNYLKAKTILVGFLLSGLFQLILSLFQLIYNRSFQGLFYYFGERLISLSSPGVAKATIQGKEFLRPYATFSHPNSLAGFFLLLYFFVLIDKRFNKYSLLKYSSLFVFTVLIFLSFSKVAIITFLILNTIYYLPATNLSCRLCKIARISVPIIVSLFFLQAITDPMTINKRFELMRSSVAIILENPLFGVGLGSYLIAQADFVSKLYLFFNQPVHNIFLLFIAETGIIVGPMVFVLIYRLIKRIWTLNRYIFLAIVMTGLLDHYWLTLQQNFMAMAVIMGASLIRFSPES